MGRFNKLINAFGNLDKIYEGIKNKVFVKEDVEQIASIRWNICTSCDFFDTKGTHCAVPGSQPCCADCGCILNLKVRSLSAHCPKNKWAAFMSKDMEEELKNNIK
jgi:hypothetical protein|tara:strand:+ start:49 stop:363 length:315 start_codon:yes stop_codon:yes gene_type:complete